MSFLGRKLLNASLNRSTNVCLAVTNALRTQLFFARRPSEFRSVSVASNVTGEVTENTADVLYKRLEIEVRGHDPAVLKSYEWFATTAAKHLKINPSRTWVPDVFKLRRRALKSAFAHGKHIVHYEFRTYFRVMEFKRLTGSTADTFLEYIQRNLPEGVAMKVTKERIEKIPTHINTQSNNN